MPFGHSPHAASNNNLQPALVQVIHVRRTEHL
jgi:hypothetical protein